MLLEALGSWSVCYSHVKSIGWRCKQIRLACIWLCWITCLVLDKINLGLSIHYVSVSFESLPAVTLCSWRTRAVDRVVQCRTWHVLLTEFPSPRFWHLWLMIHYISPLDRTETLQFDFVKRNLATAWDCLRDMLRMGQCCQKKHQPSSPEMNLPCITNKKEWLGIRHRWNFEATWGTTKTFIRGLCSCEHSEVTGCTKTLLQVDDISNNLRSEGLTDTRWPADRYVNADKHMWGVATSPKGTQLAAKSDDWILTKLLSLSTFSWASWNEAKMTPKNHIRLIRRTKTAISCLVCRYKHGLSIIPSICQSHSGKKM